MSVAVNQLRDIDASSVCELLLQPYVFGEYVDLQNHRIHGPLKLKDSQICGVDFTGSVFSGSVEFSGSVFEGLSWFKQVEICDTANFSHTRFSSDARFDGALLVKGGDFSSATFWGVGCFDGVEAKRAVLMNNVAAYGNLSLANSQFLHQVHMMNALLMGGLWMPESDPSVLHGMDTCDVFGRVETLHVDRC